MDISHKDFNTLLTKLERLFDTLDWQVPSDNVTLNKAHTDIGEAVRLLRDYLDPEPISTTSGQLELHFGTEEEDEEY